MSFTLPPVGVPQLPTVSQSLVDQFTSDFAAHFQTQRDPARRMFEQRIFKLDPASIEVENGDNGAVTVHAQASVTSTQFRGAPIPLGTIDVAASYDAAGKLVSLDEVV